ncbi:MAG: hypothetical protein JOZ41_21780 [Chloroflexi bacterium]|nr:hypothetical protein [Chloroflexota bacterium]
MGDVCCACEARARSTVIAAQLLGQDQDIVQRLDNRFTLLSQGTRTAPPRHQTLRATIDWSHELLTEDERTLFRRLAVFAGGWTLADKSLIVAEPLAEGGGRSRFLETIRQFAAGRLAEAGEVDRMRRRHFARFLDVAERYHTYRMSGGSDSALVALAAHRDTFRVALARAAEVDPEGSLRLASALDEFWRMVNASEGGSWIQRLLREVPEDSPHRLRALLTAGPLAAQVAAYAEGTELLRPVLATARHAGDRSTEAWARLWLGRLAVLGEDVAGADEHLRIPRFSSDAPTPRGSGQRSCSATRSPSRRSRTGDG